MTHWEEAAEERALQKWREEQALLPELVRFVLARASKCMAVSSCRAVALWRRRLYPPGSSGFPIEELACDRHKGVGSVPIPGSETLRKAMAR
jgi:hypothetical protein